MPGVAFPPVGPWDIGSPPSRPGASAPGPRYYGSAKTAKSPSRGRSVLPVLPRYLVALVLLCVPCSCKARLRGRSLLPRRESFPHSVGTPTPDVSTRRPLALPRSRVTPLHACPALRPRWCPGHSPWRIQDCCLPATAHRRLFPRCRLRTILWTTTLHISGLHHAACLLVPSSFVRPLLGVHVEFTPDLLARLWSGGICTSPVRTHWVTTTNFMGSLPIPRFRVYLGTSSAWFGAGRALDFMLPRALPGPPRLSFCLWRVCW